MFFVYTIKFSNVLENLSLWGNTLLWNIQNKTYDEKQWNTFECCGLVIIVILSNDKKPSEEKEFCRVSCEQYKYS